jgi:HPt (histidine-containing phosphotransfer) domain-containing protein
MSDTATAQVLAQTTIVGLDIPDALARMGNNPKLYMRIIHSFITNMPGNLDDLATSTITADTLPDYAIRIHGAKGSCYGIGANAVGDEAKALEIAAKANDLETCLRDNDAFITHTQELIGQLQDLETRTEAAEGGGRAEAAAPDASKLAALLTATQGFDIDQMNTLVEELNALHYARGGDVITRIKESFDAFDYQAIEDLITAYLRAAE